MKSKLSYLFYRCCKLFVFIVLKILFRVSAKGRANIPTEGGVVIVSNHASNLDPPIIGVEAGRMVHIMAKKELFEIPVMGKMIPHLGAFPVNRGGADRGALRKASQVLKDGSVLLIFPEGTRTRDGELQKAKPGVGLIAKMAGVPIVPAYIQGSYKALPRKQALPKLTKITVHFGQPFEIKDVDGDPKAKDFTHNISDFMMKKIAELKESVDKK